MTLSLESIEKMLGEITEGKWRHIKGDIYCDDYYVGSVDGNNQKSTPEDLKNAHFIAQSPEIVAYLLRLVKVYRKGWIEEVIDDMWLPGIDHQKTAKEIVDGIAQRMMSEESKDPKKEGE